ncbi:MAG: hypothetical protein KAV87_23490, partial [Desulfobacteraceae bacterium]|nr:hypothetical protein [Desulfobacteraceae bacterium]
KYPCESGCNLYVVSLIQTFPGKKIRCGFIFFGFIWDDNHEYRMQSHIDIKLREAFGTLLVPF